MVPAALGTRAGVRRTATLRSSVRRSYGTSGLAVLVACAIGELDGGEPVALVEPPCSEFAWNAQPDQLGVGAASCSSWPDLRAGRPQRRAGRRAWPSWFTLCPKGGRSRCRGNALGGAGGARSDVPHERFSSRWASTMPGMGSVRSQIWDVSVALVE